MQPWHKQPYQTQLSHSINVARNIVLRNSVTQHPLTQLMTFMPMHAYKRYPLWQRLLYRSVLYFLLSLSRIPVLIFPTYWVLVARSWHVGFSGHLILHLYTPCCFVILCDIFLCHLKKISMYASMVVISQNHWWFNLTFAFGCINIFFLASDLRWPSGEPSHILQARADRQLWPSAEDPIADMENPSHAI